MEHLEDCPCCGLPADIKDVQGRTIRQGWVGCTGCQLYINWKISPDGAIRKWNRRAGLTPKKALAAIESVFVLSPDELRDLALALGVKEAGS